MTALTYSVRNMEMLEIVADMNVHLNAIKVNRVESVETDFSNYNYVSLMPNPPYQSPESSLSSLNVKASCAEALAQITPEDAPWVTKPDKDGQNCIHCAVDSVSAKPDNVIIADIEKLIAAGANVTAINNNGETALHIAIKRSRVKVARYLLNKIDVNAADKDGYTALYLAVSMKLDVLIDDILAMENVDVNAMNKSNITALIKCAKEGDSMVPIVEKLVAYPGVDVNIVGEDGETALHVAASTNSVRIMELLVKNHADAAALDVDLNTPLYLAVHQNHVEAVKFLLDHMPLSAIEIPNYELYTPLEWAEWPWQNNDVRE
uniref:ANK_REP_REGION domain-containing protein n=1 Tax=Panagrellus redivivus TaxID=6233 RepID=A0A7E4VM36_PANRE